jgi:hypothetical protein
MSSGLVTFAVLVEELRGLQGPLLLFRGLLLCSFLWSGFLFALLLLGIVAFKYVSTHFEFSFLLSLYLVQNPRTLARTSLEQKPL